MTISPQDLFLFIHIFLHQNIMSFGVTLCEGASDGQILHSREIKHKNVLTAFIGLHVFNCLKNQCKVLTLTRLVSVSITHNFVSRTGSERQISFCLQQAKMLHQIAMKLAQFFLPTPRTLFYCYSIEVTVYWFPIRTGI